MSFASPGAVYVRLSSDFRLSRVWLRGRGEEGNSLDGDGSVSCGEGPISASLSGRALFGLVTTSLPLRITFRRGSSNWGGTVLHIRRIWSIITQDPSLKRGAAVSATKRVR